jgi:hypothetical protein
MAGISGARGAGFLVFNHVSEGKSAGSVSFLPVLAKRFFEFFDIFSVMNPPA